MEPGTIVARKLCKLISSPDSEMDREPQHAGKAGAGSQIYDLLQGKIDQGHIILYNGAPQNPLSIAIIIAMGLIENSKLILATITSSIQQDTIHGPKINNTNRESIKGFPKGSNSYGDGALILGNKKGSHLIIKVGQRTKSTSASAAMSSENYISGKDLMLKMKVRDGKYYGLYKLICNEDILFGAYQKIKSKPGNMTPGTDGQTLDEISKNKIGKIAEELSNETFQFKPSERIWIPKANGKMRPLGIPSPMDKIVQKAMCLLLELIYEPEFSKFSHGFRPNRGCHTAMSQLSKWSGTQWAIEGDIKGFFDNVNHKLLATLIQKKIGDQQFIDLYWKLVKAGYVEEGVKKDSLLGVSQGGILSPILSNIYLHEFDLFVENLISKYHSNAKDITKRNPKYDKVTRRVQYLRDKFPQIKERNVETNEEISKLIKLRRTITSRLPNGIRLRYVRYADDWVAGLYAPYDLVVEIRDKIESYLSDELKLELSQDKTKITNLLKDKGQFLGFYFQIHKPKESQFTLMRKGGHIRKSKISHNRM